MSENSETINKQFDEEILKYKENHIDACDHKTALKLLREYWSTAKSVDTVCGIICIENKGKK